MSMLFINHIKIPLRNVFLVTISTVLLNACLATAPEKINTIPVAPQAQAAYQRAIMAMKAGQTNRAFRLFNSINKKYPKFAGPQLNMGLIYLKKNRLSKAETAFKRAIQINRDNAIGYNLLGVVYRRSGKFVEAKDAYQKALSKNSKYANAHLNLGILYDLYLDDLKRALYHYEQYQQLSTHADTKVEKWILDLKRRVKTATAPHKTQRGQRG